MRIQRKRFWCAVIWLGIWMVPFANGTPTSWAWPEVPPQLLKEEVLQMRMRLTQEMRGGKAAGKLINEFYARDPRPEVKAFMAWACFFGKTQGMPDMFDPKRGEELVLQAIEEGSIMACYIYGAALDQNLIEGKTPVDSVPWFNAAAAYKVPGALVAMGCYTAFGWGVPADMEQGIALARQAAKLGDPSGLTTLASAFESGRIGGLPDLDRAIRLLAEAAVCNYRPAGERLQELAKTNPQARLFALLAEIHVVNERTGAIPRKIKRLAQELEAMNSDEPQALSELGIVYLTDRYGKRDRAKAMSLFERAAAKGDEAARFYLAMMKLHGWATPKDEPEAMNDIRNLADAGNTQAAYYLSAVYYWGGAGEMPEVKKDKTLAFRYVRQAAEQGDTLALINLAASYEHGIGTKENAALAAKVYLLTYPRGYKQGLEKALRLIEFAE